MTDDKPVDFSLVDENGEIWFVERYWLRLGDGPEREVGKAEWVAAERSAGFHNTLGHPLEPATAGFYTNHIRGRIERTTSRG